MNLSEMKSKTTIELSSELKDLLQQQFKLRMQKGMGQLTNNNELRLVRRDIARVKTVMTEKTSVSENPDGSNVA